MINVFISHKIKTTYLVTYFSQQEEKLNNNKENRNLLNIEFISTDKSTDKSILKTFCINKCVSAILVA